jgi:hypothetical protein
MAIQAVNLKDPKLMLTSQNILTLKIIINPGCSFQICKSFINKIMLGHTLLKRH